MWQAGRRQMWWCGRNCSLLFQQCDVQVRPQLLFSAKAGSSMLTMLLLSAVPVPHLCRRQCSNHCSPKGGNAFSLPVVICPPLGGLMGASPTSVSSMVGRSETKWRQDAVDTCRWARKEAGGSKLGGDTQWKTRQPARMSTFIGTPLAWHKTQRSSKSGPEHLLHVYLLLSLMVIVRLGLMGLVALPGRTHFAEYQSSSKVTAVGARYTHVWDLQLLA